MVVVNFDAVRVESDVDGVFLANKKNASLGTVAARAETDFYLTGNDRSSAYLLTHTPTPISLNVDIGSVDVVDGARTLRLSNRTRLNLTASRQTLAIDGCIVNSLSGQGSVKLDEIAKFGSSSIALNYANFGEISCVLSLTNLEFVDETGVQFDAVVFTSDANTDATCAKAAEVLEQVYLQSRTTRESVVFAPAPPLSKSVMYVPCGINGSKFDLASSAVSRPPSLERAAFESIATRAIGLEVDFRDAALQRFTADCARPGIKASKWGGAVANALSSFASTITPYRIDGRTVLMPGGLKMIASESWKAEASRTSFFTADDCEGTAAHITSALHDCAAIAADAELAARFPVSASYANALSLHTVGIAVLAANAGHATEAGKKGDSHVAGHAIALAIPRSVVFRALVAGVEKATEAVEDDLVTPLKERWLEASFTADELARMPEDDARELRNATTFASMHERMPFGELEALAIEGTSPIHPSLLYSTNPEDRLSRKSVARKDKSTAELIGPTIGRSVSQLDVAPTGDSHVFYSSFVEFLVAPSSPMFQSPALREHGFATSQFVFASQQNVAVAGSSPKHIAIGNFALLPLWRLGAEDAAVMDVALADVQSNTMPMREGGPAVLDEQETAQHAASLASLRALHTASSAAFRAADDAAHRSQQLISTAALVRNPSAVAHLCERLGALESKLAVHVDVLPMENCVLDHEGNDVGLFVVVTTVVLE